MQHRHVYNVAHIEGHCDTVSFSSRNLQPYEQTFSPRKHISRHLCALRIALIASTRFSSLKPAMSALSLIPRSNCEFTKSLKDQLGLIR